jgi:hypothetical protein
MRIHVVHAPDIPYGGDVYVGRERKEDPVVWLNTATFTADDASMMAKLLEENPRLLCALVSAAE